MGKVAQFFPAAAMFVFGLGVEMSGIQIPWLGYGLMGLGIVLLVIPAWGWLRKIRVRYPFILVEPTNMPVPADMRPAIVDRIFQNEPVYLDNQPYSDCVFRNCTFVWNGLPHMIYRCTIEGSVNFSTNNSVAASAVDILRFLGLLIPEFASSWHYKPTTPSGPDMKAPQP